MKSAKQKKITQSELAGILGVSRQLIAHHVKSGKSPSLGDTDGWIEFIAVNGREGSLPREVRKAIANERLRLIRAQADRVEIENRVKRSEMIEFALVQRFIGYLVGVAFFGELERLAHEFPAGLKGKNEVEIHTECLLQIEAVKKSLTSRLDTWVKKKGQV